MKPLQIAVTFDAANRKKDHSVSLRFTTNLEISTEDFAAMDRQVSSAGWLLWSANELKEEDLPDIDAPTSERKTKAQRMRAVYFLIWRQLGTDEEFETWYSRQYEFWLDKLKERLN